MKIDPAVKNKWKTRFQNQNNLAKPESRKWKWNFHFLRLLCRKSIENAASRFQISQLINENYNLETSKIWVFFTLILPRGSRRKWWRLRLQHYYLLPRFPISFSSLHQPPSAAGNFESRQVFAEAQLQPYLTTDTPHGWSTWEPP